LLIIDYLEGLRGTDSFQARQNRTIEVSEITCGLKSIAKDLSIPMLSSHNSPMTWKNARKNARSLR
jgi:replicative DNA helicase